jgi:hypothetical protein
MDLKWSGVIVSVIGDMLYTNENYWLPQYMYFGSLWFFF